MVNPYERNSLYGKKKNVNKIVDLEIPGYTSTGTRRICAAVCGGKEKKIRNILEYHLHDFLEVVAII